MLNDQTVKEKLVHEVPAFDKFKEAHFDYWFKVKDAGGIAECCDYLSNTPKLNLKVQLAPSAPMSIQLL